MVVKVKEKFEKTGNVKIIDASKKYFSRGERIVMYCDRILSKSREGKQK